MKKKSLVLLLPVCLCPVTSVTLPYHSIAQYEDTGHGTSQHWQSNKWLSYQSEYIMRSHLPSLNTPRVLNTFIDDRTISIISAQIDRWAVSVISSGFNVLLSRKQELWGLFVLFLWWWLESINLLKCSSGLRNFRF